MDIRTILVALIFNFCSLGVSGNFSVYNSNFCGEFSGHSDKHGNYKLKNFRIRVVADEAFDLGSKDLVEYLKNNHSAVDKIYFPPINYESEQARVHALKVATKHLTVIVTADICKEDQREVGFFVCAEDLKLEEALQEGDLLKLVVKSFYIKRDGLAMKYNALISHQIFEPLKISFRDRIYSLNPNQN